MADFLKAFEKTMGKEGEWDCDPLDVGGETYRGISRRHHPSWDGWKIIDAAKSMPSFPASLKNNPILALKVENFYKATYWDVMLCDEITYQELAEELFDTGVNMGISRAATFLQTALNVLNRNQQLYPDILEDGILGAETLLTLEKYQKKDKIDLLLKIINVLQGYHYIQYMKKDPRQEKFARGWFSRVTIGKTEV